MAYKYGSITNCKVANGQIREEYQCRLGWDYAVNSNQSESQDIINNKTKVKVVLEARSINSSYKTSGTGQTSTIDNTVVTSNARIDMSNKDVWQVLGTKEMWITHNPDGSLSVEITGSFTCTAGSSDYSLRSGSASVTVAPATIPRASQPSLVTWPDTTQEVIIGNKIMVHMNRVSSGFVHYVYAKWGNKTVEIGTNVGDNIEWIIPMDFCNDIPSNIRGSGTVYVDTWSNGNYVGTKSVGFTGIVPDSVKPSINSASISEGSSDVGLGVYVQGKSSLNVDIKASGAYGSFIVGYNITGIDNVTYHSSSFTSAILQQSKTYKITIKVTDSRGRIATVEREITCIAYANPKITSATVTRCNADGTVNQRGTYVKYTFKAEIAPISNKNTHTYRLGYKKRKDTYYTYIDITNNKYTLDKSDVILTDLTFPSNTSYDFQFVVIDYFATTPYIASIGTGFKLMNFNKSGKSMAIGKMSEANEDEEILEIGLDMYDKYGNLILGEKYVKDTSWKEMYVVEYSSSTTPVLVFLHWDSSQRIYAIYHEQAILLGQNGSDTCTVSIDETEKNVTFSLSNTGTMYSVEFPTN